MGAHFIMLADTDVALADAAALCDHVVARLQDVGIVGARLDTGHPDSDTGYAPGPRVPDFYQSPDDKAQFCGNSVEPTVGRHFNYWAYGPSCCGVICPRCSAAFGEDLAEFGDALTDAIGEWLDESGDALLSCPSCGEPTAITNWDAENPFAFCNFSLTFREWPPFELPGWQLDIPAFLSDITGHSIVSSFGEF